MVSRRSAVVKYCTTAFIGAVLYCEWFVYLIQPVYWLKLDCQPEDVSCTKILFIADPQIQGELAVPFPLNHLANWDSDRYLRSTFSVAVNQFRPDVLVYMGDLMDEGSISTMEQFHRYVKRLSNIFDVEYPVVQIWIPGDNDIGGENEPIRKDKIEEFEKAFYQAPVVTYRNISFYKINAIIHSYPQKEDYAVFKKLTIALSHYPVTSRKTFGQKVHKEINPDIYFCAHTHESKYVTQNDDFSQRMFHTLKKTDSPLTVRFNEDLLHEIYIPTCSYRMGTNKIGFGAAVFENNDSNMKYTVLWSSTRFPFLIFYLIVLICLIVYCLIYSVSRLILIKPNLDQAKIPLLKSI